MLTTAGGLDVWICGGGGRQYNGGMRMTGGHGGTAMNGGGMRITGGIGGTAIDGGGTAINGGGGRHIATVSWGMPLPEPATVTELPLIR